LRNVVYGDNEISERPTKKCYKHFKKREFDMKDAARSGRK